MIFERILTIIIVCTFTLFITSCKQVRSDVQAGTAEGATNPSSPYGRPIRIATIRNPSVDESSGLVASRVNPGVYWTHNDSGDGPFIYAFDQTGKSRGVLRLTGATARDWEDIGIGPGPQPNKSYLYVGDIGDNQFTRPEIVLYRIVEPTLLDADAEATKKKPRLTESVEKIRLRYPDGQHDAETLLVHPATGNVYVITKIPFERSSVYEAVAPLNPNQVTTLKRIGQIAVPSLAGGVLTGGSVSPDGTRVAFCDYFQGYEVVLPQSSKNFDDIWNEKLLPIDLGKRTQGEAIAYRLDGKALVTTSEGRSSALIEVRRK